MDFAGTGVRDLLSLENRSNWPRDEKWTGLLWPAMRYKLKPHWV